MEAARRRPGPNRDALNRLADALEATDSLDEVPNRVVIAGFRAYGADDDYIDPDNIDPDYVLDRTEALKPDNARSSRTFRMEAARRRPGPNRDALNRLADVLEATDSLDEVPNRVVIAGFRAYGADDDYDDDHDNDYFDDHIDPDYALYQTGAPEPDELRMPPILRKSAADRPPGANRDAILRLADALETTGDVVLVPRATLRDGLAALGSAAEA